MRLEPARSGEATRLTWTVEAALPQVLDVLARRLLIPAIDESLDALERLASEGRLKSISRPRAVAIVDDSAELPSLFAEADACLARQRRLVRSLLDARDGKAWFARAYEHVTDLQVEGCRKGRFTHPGWVLRIVPRFLGYYEQNLDRFRGVVEGVPEWHWRTTFAAARSARPWDAAAVASLCAGVARGAEAHIEEDLPRTLAEVWLRHYRGRCDYVRFRADYLRMRWVFREARRRLWLDVLDRCFPLGLGFLESARRAVVGLLPADLDDLAAERLFYDVDGQRERAFERGARIAAMVVALGPEVATPGDLSEAA
jgi:hypothetical protein